METHRNLINLQRPRDFGQMLSTTFALIAQEFMPLMKALVMIAGPFILLSIVVDFFIQQAMVEAASTMLSGGADDFSSLLMYSSSMMGAGFGLTLVSSLVGFAAIAAIYWSVFAYFQLYLERGEGNIPVADVASVVGQNIGPAFIATFLTTIMFAIGWLLCLAPGIYLSVPLSFVVVSRFFQPNLSLGEAFSDAFQLSKDRWWASFFVLVILIILMILFSLLVALPQQWFLASAMGDLSGGFNSVVGIVFSILINVSQLIGVIMPVGIVVVYFAAREFHMADSLQDEVENLGLDDDGFGDADNDRGDAFDSGFRPSSPAESGDESGDTPPPAGEDRWQRPGGDSSDASDDDPDRNEDGSIRWRRPSGDSPPAD